MKIGVDLKNLWLYGKGIGAFTTALLNDIGKEPEYKFERPLSLFAPTDEFKYSKELSENKRYELIQTGGFNKKSKIEKLKYDQWTFYRSLLNNKIDLLFSPYYDIPVLWKGSLITTVHDLSIVELPGIYSKGYYYYNKLLLERSLAKSLFIVTVSEYSKKKISAAYGIDPQKIKIIYNKVPDVFLNPVNMQSEKIQALRIKYSLPARFILYTGGLEARKNIQLLYSAISKLYGLGKIPPLVITGAAKATHPDSPFSYLAGKESIQLLDTLQLDDMPYLYSMADLIINASTYEGFGLPVLEALSLNKPMLCSDIPVYKEIGADTVLYFKNNSLDDLTSQLLKFFNGELNIADSEMQIRANFFNSKNYGGVFLDMFKSCRS